MAKQVFKLQSKDKLTSYMKKFSSIEKSLLFEIAGDRLVAKTHTPDKSVVKIGSALITDIMDVQGTIQDCKIGLFAVDNFINSFKQFGDGEIKLEINIENVTGSMVATELKALGKNLKISFPCASTSMFRYIDAELAEKISSVATSQFSFRIDKDTLSKISSLCSIDSEHDTLTFESRGGNIQVRGKSFELELEGVSGTGQGSISFYKTHLAFVDKEDSEFFILDKKVIIKSLESDTSIIIGSVE